jgi:hypothetical protein
MDEYVRTAVLQFDKTKALDAVEKLYGSSVHDNSFSKSWIEFTCRQNDY